MRNLFARLLAWLWYDRVTVAHARLGVRRLPIRRITIRQLRQILPAYHRVFQALGQGSLSDAAIADMVLILAVATGRSISEIESMPASSAQIIAAIHQIATAAGLEAQEGSDLGELAGAVSSILMSLSPLSPVAPAGVLSTSTR